MSFERCQSSDFSQIWMSATNAMMLGRDFLTTWDHFKDKICIIEGLMETTPIVDIWLISGSRMFLHMVIQGISAQLPVMLWVYPIGQRRQPGNIASNVDWFTVPHSSFCKVHQEIQADISCCQEINLDTTQHTEL
jgi:hypothetical protein